MCVLEQMALYLPVHVKIQVCLRYMHMASDCAAPPAPSEYNLVGGGRNPASPPETALLMWQSNGAHARCLIELVIHYDDLVFISMCA